MGGGNTASRGVMFMFLFQIGFALGCVGSSCAFNGGHGDEPKQLGGMLVELVVNWRVNVEETEMD